MLYIRLPSLSILVTSTEPAIYTGVIDSLRSNTGLLTSVNALFAVITVSLLQNVILYITHVVFS